MHLDYKNASGRVAALQMCEMIPRNHQEHPVATVCALHKGIAHRGVLSVHYGSTWILAFYRRFSMYPGSVV